MSKTLMNKTQSARAASHETQLSQEIWFHGPVSRKEAEDLLKHVSLIIFYNFSFPFLFYFYYRMGTFWLENRKDPTASTS